MRKYPIKEFSLETLEEVENSSSGEREKYWIAFLHTMAPNGYNLTPGGDGFTGPHTDEHKQFMREATTAMWKRPGFAKAQGMRIGATRGTPESRAKTSAASKKMWADDAYREAAGERVRLQWEDPIIREKRIKGNKKLVNEQEFKDALEKRSFPQFRCCHEMTLENAYICQGHIYCRKCRGNRKIGIRRIDATPIKGNNESSGSQTTSTKE